MQVCIAYVCKVHCAGGEGGWESAISYWKIQDVSHDLDWVSEAI